MKFASIHTFSILLAAIIPVASQAESLKDIYSLALQNDAQLKAAEATFKADKETRNLARAALLPQFQINGEYAKIDSESTSFFDPSTGNVSQLKANSDSDLDRETYSATLSQSLFDLSAWFDFKSGRAFSEKAAAEFSYQQQELIVRVAEAYFNVLRSIDNLSSAQAEERATQRQLEQAQQRFDVGLAAITDVHEARAAYDATVVLRLTEENNLGTSREALTVLTNKEHHSLSLLSEAFDAHNPSPNDRAQWVDFALAKNYQLKAARLQADASQLNAKAKKFEHLPTLSASYTYSDTSTEGDTIRTIAGQSPSPIDNFEEGDSQVVTLNLNWPLYLGGGISAGRRQAHHQQIAAKESLTNIQRILIQQTRSLFLTVTTDVQRVRARRQAITSSQSALEATQAGYDVGTRNIVDLLQAQRNLYAAKRDYANSRYNYIINLFTLKLQAGTLTPDDILEIDQWLTGSET